MPALLAPAWFQDTYIGIEVEQYIGLAILVAVSALTYVAVNQALRLFVRARFHEDDYAFWEEERGRLGRSLWALAVAVTFLLGFPALDFPVAVEDIVEQLASLLGAGALVLLGFRGVDIFTDVLERRAELTESRLDDQLVPITNTALKVATLVIGVLFILGNLGVNVTSLVAGLGLGGLAVALAAQDTFRNLLGGVTIFADRPFQVGDWVVVGDLEGTVEHVGFRSSRVRTFYNSVVTVPNARIVDTSVDNMGLRQWRRYKTTLGVAYHTTPDQLQAFTEGIRALIRSNPGMRKDYYIVEFVDFGATSLEILVYCFITAPDWNAELRTRHVLNLDIMRLAEELGVEFAFPTQTLHVASMPGQPAAVPAPAGRDELGEVVERFSPAGDGGQRTDQSITAGYDNTPPE
ncbi:MAG: mechanosensitive ion channel family protein [Chloroflexi bacterium]|nr:mechanosensitive ion channel family protein [Chloroflexota bacterium]